MTPRTYQAQIDELDARVTLLEQAMKERPARVSLPKTWTVKAMLAEIGKTGDKAFGGMLLTFARSYSKEHDLEIVMTGNEKKFDHFKEEAAVFAMTEATKYTK